MTAVKQSLFKKIIMRLTVIFLAVVFALLVLEIVVRAVYKFKLQPKPRTFPAVTTLYTLSANKNLVYELRPNSYLKLQKRGIEIKINSAGFRDNEYTREKGNKKRIICIGDSLTYGWNINLHETYHKQLEELLREKNAGLRIFRDSAGAGGAPARQVSPAKDSEVLGMGVVGYNTVQEYYLIKEKALAFSPDIILLQICPNDFERTLGIKKQEKGKSGGYIMIPYHDVSIPYLFGASPFNRFLMRVSHLYKFINLRLEMLIRKRNKNYSAKEYFLLGEDMAFRSLEKIKTLLDKRGVQFGAIIFPYKKMKGSYRYASLHSRLGAFLAERHIPYLDLYDAFNRVGTVNIWSDNIHPNVEGNRLAAEKILAFIGSAFGGKPSSR
jgi:lysophospholipase L1-like esterase